MGAVSIILTEGFADWETAYLLGVGGPFYGLQVRTYSPEGRAVTSQGGLKTQPGNPLEELDPTTSDVLVFCGGMHWAASDATDVGEYVRAFLSEGKAVAGICGGTLALARAGVLNDRRHTSNDLDYLTQNAPDYSGREHYQASAAAVVDGQIITAPGTAPVTFTAEVFRKAGLVTETVCQFLEMMRAEQAAQDNQLRPTSG